MRSALAIAALDLRLMRRDKVPLIVLLAMPLVTMAFVRPMAQASLRSEGFADANGAELAVPGMATMFGFFMLTFVGYALFREHGANTWDRLRVGSGGPMELLLGKLAPLFLLGLGQQMTLFVVGGLVFDLHIEGSRIALSLVAAAFVLCLVTLGLALASVLRTVQQVNSIGNLSTVLLGGLAGALSPAATLPVVLKAVAPFTPGYWAMEGYTRVILESGGVTDTLPIIGVLGAFAVGFAAIAARRFDFEDTKIYWA